MLQIWHGTPDAPNPPRRVSPGESVSLRAGTWPIEPGQSVWVTYRAARPDGSASEGRVEARWERNEGPNSYWRAELGPFSAGDFVLYELHAASPQEEVSGPVGSVRVRPRLHLALLWHQHQPLYKDLGATSPKGSYLHPWVRLHALRDYYSMAALVAQRSGIHLTINLTPCLLWQLEDYLERGATDRALELTVKPAGKLTAEEREEILGGFFDADWHNQVFAFPRYRELFTQRQEGRPFSAQDLRDLQMWFNLAWFGAEFKAGEVRLATGDVASVRRFVERGRGFSQADLEEMVAEQRKVLGAVVPIHRQLQEAGQIEVSTTPFYHPILPLLIDTDQATLDRPGSTLPRRFVRPEDAEAQVERAVDAYRRWFGRDPRGAWPAEGAVSREAVALLARHGLRWVATDRGVLARSGRWGYEVEDPDVLCQPYRPADGSEPVSLFFRDTRLSDGIGFRYHGYADYAQAARDFVGEIKARFAGRLQSEEDRVLTVVLDGENAWGAYRHDARPFLHALYGLLGQDPDLETVTFSEFLDGAPSRGLSPHPQELLPTVHELATGSWIDEQGSAPGVDLGTWIGEEEENRAWQLLAQARDALAASGATPETAPAAFEALYAAEGSDWFWWFGADQDSGKDGAFDHLFRLHLRRAYGAASLEPPPDLDLHIVPHAAVWSLSRQLARVRRADRLIVRTHCPGELTWRLDDGPAHTQPLVPAGGVMAGVQRYDLTLGPFAAAGERLRFRFRCIHPDCDCKDRCCSPEEHAVEIVE